MTDYKIKDPSSKITPQQAKYLWSFEVRNSTANAIQWFKSGVNKGNASEIITACATWEKDKTSDNQQKAHNLLNIWSINFTFKHAAPPEPETIVKTETIIETKEIIKQVHINQTMELSQIIETIFPVVKGATILQDIFDAKTFPLPKAKTSQGYHKPENFDTILASIKAPNVNVLIKGPAGSGKSMMGKELAKHLELDFFCMSCSGGMRYAHIFGGDKLSIDPETKQTISEFELSNLMEAIQKPCLIMMDELFTLEPDLLMGLNGLFEPNTREIEIKGHGKIKFHDDSKVIACTNTDGRNNSRTHVGAKRVDGSSLDRFVTFNHTYSSKVERNILNTLPKLIRTDVAQWLKDLRKQLKVSNIEFDPSTRRLQSCVNLIAGNLPHDVAFTAAFLGQLSPTELKKIGMDKLTPAEPEKDFDNAWAILAKDGKKIEAIKAYRDKTGCDWKEAKRTIDNYLENN